MKIEWVIHTGDIARIKAIVASTAGLPTVLDRQRRNVQRQGIDIGRDACWRTMVGCLLTTQQKSGPASPIVRFLGTDAAILQFDACVVDADIGSTVRRALQQHGGIRRANTIAEELAHNIDWLARQDGWARLVPQLEALRRQPGKDGERSVARFLAAHVHGFGPKQSRNFLQWLGLSQYEIPVDSRVVKWFRKDGFPIPLNAALLVDPDYYEFVLDAIQSLCAKAGILPCMLDAAIFAAADAQ